MDTAGYRLREARRAAGVSVSDLASRLGLSPSTIRNQENGTNGVPAKLIPQYATLLGVSVEWLMTGAGEAPKLLPRIPRPQIAMFADGNGNARLELNVVVPMSVALQVIALVQGEEK